MPSRADETEFLRTYLAGRVSTLDLEQLRRVQAFVERLINGRHEEDALIDYSKNPTSGNPDSL